VPAHSHTLALQGITAADIAALWWAKDSPTWEIYANDPSVQRRRSAAIDQQMQADVAAAAAAAASTNPAAWSQRK